MNGDQGFNPRVLAGGRDIFKFIFTPFIFVSIRASSREDATHPTAASSLPFRFQSARPRGRTRHGLCWLQERWSCFNPRVLAGGHDSVTEMAKQNKEFQSARPRGRTRPDFTPAPRKGDVSIRASSREDTTWQLRTLATTSGFNPRVLAGGRDLRMPAPPGLRKVSIRASSREDAT